MSSPPNEYAFDPGILRQAARNWRERTEERVRNRTLLDHRKFDEVESRARLAKHANRLVARVRRALPRDTEAISPGLRELVERQPFREEEMNNLLMERVIGETRDFLSVAFLEQGRQAMRSVGRVVSPMGSRVSYGTGFLVSPRLLMTNWHVLRTAEHARGAYVEMDYQLDQAGNPLRPRRFDLRPDDFFLSDETLDYAVVAVAQSSRDGAALADYGHSPLIGEEGKIILDNCVNIVQHPRGEMKQVVIRENRLIDLLSDHLHYEGDTERGSSGSPAFSDQWEVVALHHSAVPRTDDQGNYLDVDGNVWREGDDPARLAWVANEGVRVSRLIVSLRGRRAELRPGWHSLLDELLKLGGNPPGDPAPPDAPPFTRRETAPAPRQPCGRATHLHAAAAPAGSTITVTVPVTLTVTVGTPVVGGPQAEDAGAVRPRGPRPDGGAGREGVEPDPDYDRRPGYDPGFLGFPVPLPRLTASTRRQAVRVPGAPADAPYELRYHHYSVIMNGARRLAFVAAVNYHGQARFYHEREKGADRWFYDERIGREYQAGNELYANNDLDRGHLVRRADAAWGETEAEAKRASDDTFHFPNCSPQDEVYNQASKSRQRGLLLWGDLEEHIARQASATGRLCIFNGPVFRSDDPDHRGLQVPTEYWKVVVFDAGGGRPRAVGFLLSQAELIRDLPREAFDAGEFRTYQLPLREIEARTRLSFGDLTDHDPIDDEGTGVRLESESEVLALQSLGGMVL